MPLARTLTAVITMAAVLLVAFAAGHSDAGQYNRVLDIGDHAPTWSGLPGVDGQQHSSDQLKSAEAVVVVFTCNSCPYAVDAEDRVIALHNKFAERDVAVVAINVNKNPEDRLPAMKQRAEENSFPFSYLFDESQQIAREFGAKYTPEFYVLDSQRRVAYMGSLDDSPDGKDVTQRYVEDAVNAVLKGNKPAVTETVPIGCRVRIQRNLRGR